MIVCRRFARSIVQFLRSVRKYALLLNGTSEDLCRSENDTQGVGAFFVSESV